MLDSHISLDDTADLSETLRDSDRREIAAGSGRRPIESIVDSIQLSSVVMASRSKSGLLAIMGVVPARLHLPSSPWMLGTTRIPRHAVTFMRDARDFILSLPQGLFPLASMTDAHNIRSHEWLRRLGFYLEPRSVNTGRGLWRVFTMAEKPHV